MAIGARRRDIALQFLIEAGLLALLGSGAGVALALIMERQTAPPD
jgi:ABC-type antimicrobial peptide transport system permease subunit